MLARPRLERRLETAVGRRLTVLVAGAGAGKSTLLATWAAPRRAGWYTLTEADRDLGHLSRGLLGALGLRVPALPGAAAGLLEQTLGPEATGDERARARACAALLADALAGLLSRDLVLVLDDFQELRARDPGAWLVEALCRQAPERLRILISTREPLPFSIERLRGQGQVTVLGGGALAFDAGEVAAITAAALGPVEPELATELHAATAGWPAAVRLAVEALIDVPPPARRSTLARLLRGTGPIYDYLAEEVLGRESAAVRALLAAVAPLPRFSAPLCAAMDIPEAEAVLRSLEERGLFVQPIGDGGWFTLHPLIREYLGGRATDPGTEARLGAAAAWFEAAGADRDAIACWLQAGDRAAVARLLERHGPAMLNAGEVDAVVAAVEALPAAARSPVVARLEGQARQIRGDWEGALAAFQQVAPPGQPIDPGVAWRMGLIHHLRGELAEALATYRRARGTDATEPCDTAILHAWLAAALWLRGDADGCRGEAALALEAAVSAADDQALAVAHTTAAMVAALDGDRRANDAHYLRALDHAGRAGDVLQAIRIRANRGSRLVEEGYYEEALDELRQGIALAEVTGFAAFHALALSNRGDALRRLGRFEEAIADLEASRALYQRLESRFVSYPLAHLGDVHAERGAFAVAMACYEEAIAVAEGPGDVQGLRPALAGLAELLAARDPLRARELADRAVGFGPGIGIVRALLAVGQVALVAPSADGRARAAEAARSAATEARARRDRAGLAEALELEAQAEPDPTAARARIDEALQLWRDLRAPVAAARAELRRAELARESPPPEAIRTLQAAGAAWSRRPHSPLPDESSTAGHGRAVGVRTLGGFEVVRDGRGVPIAEWGSRKARDLLKILITRRGQHFPREQLQELLWPGEDPGRASRRLSAAISTVRSIFDPQHERPAAWFVAADRDAVWLERGHVDVDVEEFLAGAERGLELAAHGDPAAVDVLRAAESAHRGEFLVEDVFEDWSAALREECRQAYAGVAHALARLAAVEADHATAARFYRRILEYEEFDERAHLGLVAALAEAGQPADARRAYAAYLARMEELGVEAAPFPA